MKKLILLLLISALSAELIVAQKKNTENYKGAIKYEDYQKLINKNDQVLYVINFWATWCSPCVEELPAFMEVNKQFSSVKNFKMILISLDSKREVESELLPFLISKNIKADVYLMDDIKRMNYWIPAIDKNWTGSIPATFIYQNGKKLFFAEKQLNQQILIQTINQFITL
jgi:thiol-disulfide isomerase/thioredoxin